VPINRDSLGKKRDPESEGENPANTLPKRRVLSRFKKSTLVHPRVRRTSTSSNPKWETPLKSSFNLDRDQADGPQLQVQKFQLHTQPRNIQTPFKIKLHSPWIVERHGEESEEFIAFFIVKDHLEICTRFHTHKYKLIICYTIS
jgi:hypothetical protein